MGVCLIFESTDGDEAGGERGTETARRARCGEGKARLFTGTLSFHGPSRDITPPPPEGRVLHCQARPGLRGWETWLPLLSGGAMQGTQSEGFRVHAPTQCHTLVCCAPVHRISPLKETGDLGVSGASLLVQVVFPCVLGVRVIQTRSVQKGVFPLAHVSSLFTLICGG